MANFETYARTSYFQLDEGRTREEFAEWVDRWLSSEGNMEVVEQGDDEVAIIDMANWAVGDEAEWPYPGDGFDYLLEHFLAPGHAVAYVWAGHKKMRFVGGGAMIGWKTLEGVVHAESICTSDWIDDRIPLLREQGITLTLPES